ncbi:MAG: substrate-binding domain-containing protein [Trueperaceae bacterium]
MKRLIILAAAVLLTVATAQVNVAWVHSNAAAQSEQRVKDGFEEWVEGRGWNVSFVDSGGSAERTAENLQNAVSRGVDAIILTMSDLRASAAAIQQAADAGIPIFTVDSGWVPGVVVDVTTNNWDMGAKVSVFLLDSIGEGNIIFLRMAEHHGTRKRGDVMEVMLREYPNVRVLEEHNIDYTAFFEDTTRVMQDFAARYGDQIDGVWAPWDEPAQAAVNVLQAAGIDAIVTGIDGHPQAVQEVMNPDSIFAATVAQPFEEMGAQVGEWIRQVVEDGVDPDTMFSTNTIYMNAPLVTGP